MTKVGKRAKGPGSFDHYTKWKKGQEWTGMSDGEKRRRYLGRVKKGEFDATGA